MGDSIIVLQTYSVEIAAKFQFLCNLPKGDELESTIF